MCIFFFFFDPGASLELELDIQVSSECKYLLLQILIISRGFSGIIWFSDWSLKSMQKARIQIWLFEQKDLRIEGRIIVSVY